MSRGASAGHWRGYKKRVGCMAGRRGRETWRRARVRTRQSTAGARKADLIRRSHGAEREKGTCGSYGSILAKRARKIEREREISGRSNWCRQVGSTG
jgi:hypothetical protein